MPAAAVFPAPSAFFKVVAVKKLAIGFLPRTVESALAGEHLNGPWASFPKTVFTLMKIKCFRHALMVSTLAWNNQIGRVAYFVGLCAIGND